MRTEADIVRIVRVGAQGDGVADRGDGIVHIPHALPGERYRLSGAAAELVGAASASRRAPLLCPHFPACGGCTVQHMSDDLYRSWKAGLLPQAFAQRGISIAPRPMIEAPLGSRRRAVLTARRTGGKVDLGYHGPGSHRIEPIVSCAVLAPRIVSALPALTRLCATLASADGDLRLTILQAGNGLDVSIEGCVPPRAADGRASLAREASAAGLIRLTVGGDPIFLAASPVLRFAGAEIVPPPGAFVQAVCDAEVAMTVIVADALKRAKRAADLFCGLGTFTFSIAKRARTHAVDSERPLIDALGFAARHAQGLKPIETTVRDLFQDPLSPRELDVFDAVVFDPPRSGAKAQAQSLARSKVGTVAAVSCNPATLARDVRVLLDGGYRLESVTPLDQFLYAPHLEAVAILRR